jgi:DNA-binding NarL/FixJ family response regulator
MEDHKVLTLVAVMPGRVRDGLEAMLASMPQVEIVGEVEDSASTLRLISTSRPALVLLDADLLNDKNWEVLRTIKTRWPQTQCLLLTETSRQVQVARSNGADEVLFKGFSMTELSQVIRRLRQKIQSMHATRTLVTLSIV